MWAPRLISGFKGVAVLAVVLGVSACDWFEEPEFQETVEIIPLPDELASNRLAHQIGTDVHHALQMRVDNDPQRFDPDRVGFQINWGKLEDFESGKSTYYIKIIGKSVAPMEQEPAARELMHYAIERVYKAIEDTSQYVEDLNQA